MDDIYKINIDTGAADNSSGSYNTFNASYSVSTGGNKIIKLMSYKEPEIEHYRDYLNSKVYEGNYAGYSTSLNLETNKQPSSLIISPSGAASNIQVFKEESAIINSITSNDILGNLIIHDKGENYRCFCYREDLSPSVNFTAYDDSNQVDSNTSEYKTPPILSLDEQKLTLFPRIYGTHTVTPIQYLFNPINLAATQATTWANWTDSVIVDPGSPYDKLMYLRLNVDPNSVKLNNRNNDGSLILYAPFDYISPFNYGYNHLIDQKRMKFTYKNPIIDTMIFTSGRPSSNTSFLGCIFSTGDTNYFSTPNSKRIGCTTLNASRVMIVQNCTSSGDSSKKYFYSGNFNQFQPLALNMKFG